jgi:hypothetical protein
MAKSSQEVLETSPPLLTVFWCDRCSRSINANDERDHYHHEQCGGCLKFKAVDGDWGYCQSHESAYGGRKMFEHDTCSKWSEGKW